MEKYTSEMVKELLDQIISIATTANVTAQMHGGNLEERTVKRILHDLHDARNEAMLIRNRMLGWEYAAFDVIMMEEVKQKFAHIVHEEHET